METTNPTTNAAAANYNECQLFLHDDGPDASGWTLRYRDSHGDEQHLEIEPETNGAIEDAKLSELAKSVESLIGTEDENIKVKCFNRHGQQFGSIIVNNSSHGHTTWRTV